MRGVTESMAGRAAVLHLLPLSLTESTKVSLLRGGFPEVVVARPGVARLWFSSFLQTYLERDVRAVAEVRHVATFRRFLGLLASRTGQILNRSDLAGPLGVSVPTISHWIDVLQTTALVLLVSPFYENFGKRLVKSPKLYLADPGLACHLLGLHTLSALESSPFLGPVWEGFVATEIVKQQVNAGRRQELYWFRDQQGLEVDFVYPETAERLVLVEAKATRTPRPEHALPIARLRSAMGPRRAVRGLVVHRGTETEPALAPGAAAVPLNELRVVAQGRGSRAPGRPKS